MFGVRAGMHSLLMLSACGGGEPEAGATTTTYANTVVPNARARVGNIDYVQIPYVLMRIMEIYACKNMAEDNYQ